VLLAVLPSSTGPILGTAHQQGFKPVWIGNTPSWIDRFFDPQVLPPVVLANFHVASGMPIWGERRPGMDGFIKAWESYGKEMGEPNWYTLMSYANGLIQLQALRAAIEAGEVTRARFKQELQSLKKADAGGILEPLDLSSVPYVPSIRARVLGLDLANRKFKVLGEYAEPRPDEPGEPGAGAGSGE
jgi:ABC-type branched-subunit amino acid transport system substrate-binding protein